MLCEVFGKVIEEGEKHIVVCSWDTVDPKDDEERRENWTIYSVIKSTIVKKKKLIL